MKDILKLLRVQHYIKNLLVFVPLFFAGKIFDVELIKNAVIGFICFCLISSAVYVVNDIKDVEKDRKHPKKRTRPIASGRVSVKLGACCGIICVAASLVLSGFLLNKIGLMIILLYFCINVAYSFGLKNKPIVDIVILASGFVLRIIYGGIITDITISKWLYLVIVSGALFMGLGKRRNELIQQKETREVLKYYTQAFLDKNMYVCVTLVIVFYSMWTLETSAKGMIWTVPILMIILMKYSMNIEGESDGDPVDVLLNDKILMILSILYAICIFVMLYVL